MHRNAQKCIEMHRNNDKHQDEASAWMKGSLKKKIKKLKLFLTFEIVQELSVAKSNKLPSKGRHIKGTYSNCKMAFIEPLLL
jgi:hypothetical protein